MSKTDDYVSDINKLKDEAVSDLEKLLKFSANIVSTPRVRKYAKTKSVFRYNTFSALYQRADAVAALTKINQGASSAILIRSMWETLAEYDFVNLEASNLNLQIRLASQSKQQLTNWSHVQKLRAAHPKAETWKRIISDAKIASTIKLRQTELKNFNEEHPSVKLDAYQSLLSRLEAIDTSRLKKNPNIRTLNQFDYRTVYSLLSDDTHSTVIGNAGNSRRHSDKSFEIRLDAPLYEGVRSAHVAYQLMLRFLSNFNTTQRLGRGDEIKSFRKIQKSHEEEYKSLQKKYGFS